MDDNIDPCNQHIEYLEPFDNEYINKNDWCEIQDRKILQHQEYLANRVTHCNSNMLIYHGLGSGKTCTSIVIIETLKTLLQNCPEGLEVIISTPASMINQYTEEFTRCPVKRKEDYVQIPLPNAIKTFQRMIERGIVLNKTQEKQYKEKEREYKKIVDAHKMKFLENIKIVSHNFLVSDKYIQEILNNGKKKIIVIDEIQNCISETSQIFQKLENLIYAMITNKYDNKPKSLLARLFVMTATPFENFPNDIGLIMKILNPLEDIKLGREPFIDYYSKNTDEFRRIIKNRISYFSGGNPNNYPMKRIIIKEYPLTQEQHFKYQRELSKAYEDRKARREFFKMMNSLGNDMMNQKIPSQYTYLRQLCNSARPVEEYEHENLEHFAPKIKNIVDQILSSEGTVFVFSGQIQYRIDILEKALQHYGFQYWNPSTISEKSYFIWIGDTDKDVAEMARKVFNSKENVDGAKIKVIIGSETVAEGVEFKNVKTVHIVDPWWNNALIRQVIARCIRFGSHCDTYKKDEDWIPTVNIYRHISVFEPSWTPVIKDKHAILSYMTVEQYMVYMSSKKQITNNKFDALIKESALDCKDFKKGNLFRLEERLIPQQTDKSKYFQYYQNPLNQKKYCIKDRVNIMDLHSFDFTSFKKMPDNVVFEYQRVSDDGKTLENANEENENLIIGKTLTNTLIGYENITCFK